MPRSNQVQLTTQARVNAIVAAARAASEPPARRPVYSAPSRPPLDASHNAIELRVQEELDHTKRMIEALGDVLASDSILLARYQTALQSIDVISQTVGHLARVIGSHDKREAIERIGMSNLKARLNRCSGKLEDDELALSLHRSRSNPFARQNVK